jgi:hypothetical protein
MRAIRGLVSVEKYIALATSLSFCTDGSDKTSNTLQTLSNRQRSPQISLEMLIWESFSLDAIRDV